jgi:hypothetical protein
MARLRVEVLRQIPQAPRRRPTFGQRQTSLVN